MAKNSGDRIVELTKKIEFGRHAIEELTGKIQTEDRESTPEERKQITDQMQHVDTWNEELQVERALLELDTKISSAQRKAIKPELEKPIDKDEPAGMPPKEMRFKNFGDQLMAVARADPRNPQYALDRRLQTRATGMTGDSPTDGGFLVQADYSSELLRRVYAGSPVVQRVRRMTATTQSDTVKINAIAESSRVSSIWGGIILYWLGQGSTKTASRPEFRQMELKLHKVAGLYYATDELLQDASLLASVANDGFSEALDVELERVILRGTGAGQPLGILASPALISVAQETYQGTGSLVYENLVKMYARLWARSLPRAAWYIDQSVIPELMMMTTSTSPTSGYAGTPVWLPSNNVAYAPYGTILGLPVYPIENGSAVGTVGDIMLLDLSQYVVLDKGGPQQASSIHVNFIYDETCFRIVYRVDGQPAWNTTLTPKSGSSTVSPFVALATRT
jgi:HK97 family phage major capsid protein